MLWYVISKCKIGIDIKILQKVELIWSVAVCELTEVKLLTRALTLLHKSKINYAFKFGIWKLDNSSDLEKCFELVCSECLLIERLSNASISSVKAKQRFIMKSNKAETREFEEDCLESNNLSKVSFLSQSLKILPNRIWLQFEDCLLSMKANSKQRSVTDSKVFWWFKSETSYSIVNLSL